MASPYSYTGYSPYNQYQQTYYPSAYSPAAQSVVQQSSGIVWVQGEAGAKSYLVGAGQSVLLMDSENSCFYIKSTDNSGMPMPLRVFDYTERVEQPAEADAPNIDLSDYVTHEELKKWADKLKATILKEGKPDAKKPAI